MIEDLKMDIFIRNHEFEIIFDCEYETDYEDNSCIVTIEIFNLKVFSDRLNKFISPTKRFEQKVICLLTDNKSYYSNTLETKIKKTWEY